MIALKSVSGPPRTSTHLPGAAPIRGSATEVSTPTKVAGPQLLQACPMTVAVFGRPAFPSGFIAPCLPTKATEAPSGALWVHEIKHDGFRVIARKDGKQVRL